MSNAATILRTAFSSLSLTRDAILVGGNDTRVWDGRISSKGSVSRDNSSLTTAIVRRRHIMLRVIFPRIIEAYQRSFTSRRWNEQ